MTKTVKKPKNRKQLNVKQVTQVRSLFTSRLATHTETICDTEFYLKALTSAQMDFVNAKAFEKNPRKREPLVYLRWCLKFGMTGWKNLVDQDGKDVEFETTEIDIYGRKYQAVVNRLIDGEGETGGLDSTVKIILGAKIGELSNLSTEEGEKLDF